MPGRYAETMIESFVAKYGKVKPQQVPCGNEAREISNAVLLPPDEASPYQSLVGSGIYLSQERIELGYVIKQLASGMRSPSRGHLQVMRRLIGYLKKTLGNYNHLDIPSYGKDIHFNYDSKWVLESFTDSDWSGDRTTRRSTSSSVHALSGIILFHSGRGQRVSRPFKCRGRAPWTCQWRYGWNGTQATELLDRQFSHKADCQQTRKWTTSAREWQTTLGARPNKFQSFTGQADWHHLQHWRHRHQTFGQEPPLCLDVLVQSLRQGWPATWRGRCDQDQRGPGEQGQDHASGQVSSDHGVHERP